MAYEVSYNGRTWQTVEDEARMRRILADHYTDPVYPMKELECGHQVRTTFAVYRKAKDE